MDNERDPIGDYRDPPSSEEYMALLAAADAIREAALYMEQKRMVCNSTGRSDNDQTAAEIRQHMVELELIVLWSVGQYVIENLPPHLRERVQMARFRQDWQTTIRLVGSRSPV